MTGIAWKLRDAGQFRVRTVEISKGGSQFQFRRFIETGMAFAPAGSGSGDFCVTSNRTTSPAKLAQSWAA